MSLVLHSALAPGALADALRRSIDEERRTLFSLSGYSGSCPVLGEVMQDTFRLQKRRYWRNDFSPQLYGKFQSETGGSRIEAQFGLSPWVRMFMRIWLIGVGAIGGPIFVLSSLDLLTGSSYLTGDSYVGLIVPPAMILWGFILPKIGRFFGQGDEQILLEFIQRTLAARIEKQLP
jgi:hypothetical protein